MQIRTLAPFVATRPDGTRALPAGKPLALLLHLALAPGRRTSRAALTALLWDRDDDEKRLSNNFRQALHQVRKVLPEGTLVTKPGTDVLELTAPVAVDALAFEAQVAAGAHAEAWALYERHFLEDYAAAGAAEFERWADGVRTRLREQWLRIGEALARQRMEAGELDAALIIARRLRDDAPDRQVLWRLLFAVLVRQGQVLRAVAEAEALQRRLDDEDEPLERETRDAIEKLRRAAPVPVAATVTVDAGTLPRRAETIGREAVFSALLKQWQRAAAGRGGVVVLRAAAGLGKTRVLDDLRTRLQALGASVVAVRARPSDRGLPNSLAATLVEATAAQRGAAGVSAASAAILVDLVPALSNVYPSAASAAISDGGDSPALARTLALCELVDAVAEEAPLALLVDDLHYADAESRAMLERLGDRLGGRAVLLVLASRPSGASLDLPVPTLDLAPLDAGQVEALLASIAPDAQGCLPAVAAAIHGASDGVPLLVLAAAELLVERGLVQLNDDGWTSLDPAAAAAALAGGRVLDLLLRDTPKPALRLLAALAVAGVPLEERELASVVDDPAAPLLVDLAQRALVQQEGTRWEPAHDRVADAAVEVLPVADLADVRLRLGRRLLANGAVDATDLRLAARLLGQQDAAESVRAFLRWLRTVDRAELWREPTQAARSFLAEEATPVLVAALADAVPWEQRLRYGRPGVFRAGVAAVLLVAASVAGLLLAPLLQPRAVAIALAPIPNSNGFLWDAKPSCRNQNLECDDNVLDVQATFVATDGQVTPNAPRTAVLRLQSATGVRLIGDSIAPVRRGRADFGRVRAKGSGPFTIEVTADGLPPVKSREFVATDRYHRLLGWVRLAGGRVNGQTLSPLQRTVRVRPGETFDGYVDLDWLTMSPNASMLLTGVPTWGDRTTNWWAMDAQPPHGHYTRRYPFTQEWRPNWRLRAPMEPGRYRIVFFSWSTTEFKYAASMTAWQLGAPIWNDGNDVADWPETLMAELDLKGFSERGAVVLDGWRDAGGRLNLEKPPIRNLNMIAGTTITVVVEPPR